MTNNAQLVNKALEPKVFFNEKKTAQDQMSKLHQIKKSSSNVEH